MQSYNERKHGHRDLRIYSYSDRQMKIQRSRDKYFFISTVSAYQTEELLIWRVNDKVSGESVLPLEALCAGRADERGLARVLR